MKAKKEASRPAIDPHNKLCTRCGITKERSVFRKDAKRRDGLYPWCIDCWRVYVGGKAQVRASMSKAEYDRARRERLKREIGEPAYRAIHRESHLLRNFNMTLAEYDELLASQNGRCAICRRTPIETGISEGGAVAKSFAVDHDHACCPGNSSCGSCVRGLLCGLCNTGLGSFGDDVNLLSNAADYLSSRSAVIAMSA